MSNVQKFKQYLVESERLKKLGLTNPMDFDEAFEALSSEWSSDPEIEKARDIILNRTQELFDKYINLSDPEHEEQYEAAVNTWYYASFSDIGLLEFILLNQS